jgi:hypothetical protein
MKTLITTTAFALIAFVAAPAAFADTKTVLGCEIVDMGGYSNKADPTCQFANTTRQTGTIYRLIDTDNDPETDPVSVAFDGNKD